MLITKQNNNYSYIDPYNKYIETNHRHIIIRQVVLFLKEVKIKK
jgi:hypothetical protein